MLIVYQKLEQNNSSPGLKSRPAAQFQILRPTLSYAETEHFGPY